jgi:16S rRNA (uracil1498-N3)-methyltransferase
MHRFYLPPQKARGQPPVLSGSEAHHALHVLRLRRGEKVVLLDGVGGEYLCQIETVRRDRLELRTLEQRTHPALPWQLTLCQALPKGKLIEAIIQKATELGVTGIVPVISERVITALDERVAAARQSKWQAVAVEAIKQCGCPWLPVVEQPGSLRDFLRNSRLVTKRQQAAALQGPGARPSPGAATFDGDRDSDERKVAGLSAEFLLVASLQPGSRHPRACFLEFHRDHGRLPISIMVFVGPEGDFTPDELQAIEAAGARPISLGPHVLRVETAALYCLSVLSYELRSAAGASDCSRSTL